MERHITKEVQIGNRWIGGNHPIAIQSMTNTKTEDVAATVAQIKQLTKVGCEIIRCAVPTQEAAAALTEIKKQITIPLVADIHFDYRLAIAAMEHGADKIRINPGNIVKATDYRGKTLKFTVSGKVNAAKTGKYKITYTAKDAKGNKTQKSIVITVKDTKAPSISLKRKTLTYNKAVSKEKLVSAIKADVVAKDLGKKLASKYVFVDAREAHKAVTAMERGTYGTYSVTVYVKDTAGNKSRKLKVKINFVNPNPGTDQPDQPEPDTPGVVTDSAITVQ